MGSFCAAVLTALLFFKTVSAAAVLRLMHFLHHVDPETDRSHRHGDDGSAVRNNAGSAVITRDVLNNCSHLTY